ncbi:Retrovirus-related Pol poly from transposon TNT 1-94 isoform B [Chlorella sorokiniana]|nr:Retrovirus-related Pol poly from transposon TNT 1-94 isoform B [Chlorella sorokiniana]|eukprot:PRW61567.1 Retrovirus-related Pol poly from transposon TNT 1-94 isoform B [Chlorella sorokiniana]
MAQDQAAAPKSATSMRWVLDTGASRHLTGDASILSNMRPMDEDLTITFGNGGTGKATATGDVYLATTDAVFQLTEVLYIPEATESLISVRHATKHGLDFTFSADRCDISRNGHKLATAPSMGDAIYYLSGHSRRLDSPALTAKVKETPQLWHERFGHLGYDGLAQLTNLVTGMKTTAEEFKAAGEGLCEPCGFGKQHRAPFKPSSSTTNRPLALVHTDLCGPLPVASQGGNLYFLTLLDDYSKFSAVRPIARKSDTPAALKDTLKLLESLSGYKTQRIRCDNGSEFINEDLATYCSDNGIKLETTVRYTPQQNGATERLNRTLMDKVRPMLAASGVPKSLWADAVVTANYVRNRSPVSDRDKTPYELFYGTKPDVSHLRTFGARCYAVIPKPLRTKLDDTSEPGRFIGYPAGTKGYKILLNTGKVIISRDVTFKETGGSSTGPPGEPGLSDEEGSDADEDMEPAGAGPSQPGPAASRAGGSRSPPASKRPRRAATDVPAEIWREEGYKITGRKRDLGAAHSAIIQEPASLEEAQASEQAEQWQQAADDEMASLLAYNTWELEPVPPGADMAPGVKPIPVKWVFKIKRDANGNVERYKARLVAKGFLQQEGIDYEEVFAPVSKYTTVRTVLAQAAAQDMEIHQIDIKTAFLYGELEEDAAKGVLRYIAGTTGFGITYGGNSLEAFCDADYAGDCDTRRSTTGYVFMLGGGAISWSSRLQPTVAASTTEAEYMAAAYAIKEGLWLRTLLSDLGMRLDTITINADNQGAIKLLKNPVFSMRSKHIDVIYHFARERVTRKDISFKYIPTTKMVADALTKPLPAAKLAFCRTAMGITSMEQ